MPDIVISNHTKSPFFHISPRYYSNRFWSDMQEECLHAARPAWYTKRTGKFTGGRDGRGMLLALDMGNTNITIGVFEGTRLMLESRVATDRTKMEDQYAIDLMDILRLYGINTHDFEGAIISSVVPPLEHAIRGAVKKVTGVTPLMVGPGTKTGVNIPHRQPRPAGTRPAGGGGGGGGALRRALRHLGPGHRHHRVGGGPKPVRSWAAPSCRGFIPPSTP